MTTHKEFFGCRYPIVAVAMNQVSDIDLAIAVAQAGGFPSISIFNYELKGTYNWKQIDTDLQRYKSVMNNCNLIFSIENNLLLNTISHKAIVDLVKKHRISHIQLIPNIIRYDCKQEIKHCYSILQDLGTKLIIKSISFPDHCDWFSWADGRRTVDAVELKGPEGAGRVTNKNITLEQLIIECQTKFPNIPIIASGGIGTNDDVKRLLNLGVMAVGAGTIFAASTESPVSVKAKQKLIDATAQSLSKIDTFFDHDNQNALKFGNFDQPDSFNNTKSLKSGVQNGENGHIFAGHAINCIDEILPVDTIIQRLIQGLDH